MTLDDAELRAKLKRIEAELHASALPPEPTAQRHPQPAQTESAWLQRWRANFFCRWRC